MKNNKGLSTIVATLIIILLVLVAVGIIWVVVKNVIDSGAGQIQSGSDCLAVEVQPTKVLCMVDAGDAGNNGTCDITYSRSAGGDEIGGIKLVLEDNLGDSNFIKDIASNGNNLNPLVTTTEYAVNTGIINVSKVKAVVYFLDDSGNEQLCAPSTELVF